MKNGRSFESSIPIWIKRVIGDTPNQYLVRTNKELLKNLELVYSCSRVSPTDFVVFQLSIALITQQEKNRFYEKAISDLTGEVIGLRARINKFEEKQ
ncbi:MAG: hypothetical protein PHC39_04730 [Proteiniphilum sp.]|nr:hypothetical protein [Proteiniphilum sp.]